MYGSGDAKKFSFKNDYSEMAHPHILLALAARATEVNDPYGEDKHSAAAADMIRSLCKAPNAEVAFIAGGTATNALAISLFLRNPYEAAVCAVTGHINVHETGAIENTGHKVISVPSSGDGKLTPALIQPVLDWHSCEHMVVPKLVYISQSTELGTIYSKAELAALSEYCHKNGLYLYLDGARLGSALMAKESDLTLEDIAALTDAFYIGGTKNGLLFGEALVMLNEEMREHYRYMIKQKGYMLAKGCVAGAMFEAAFKDGLFFAMAMHENEAAEKIADAVRSTGFEFYAKPQTNQVFVILPDELADELVEKFGCNIESRLANGRSAVRIVTSWATTDEGVNAISEWFLTKYCAGLVKEMMK